MSALRWAAQHKVQAVAVAGVAQLLILLVVLYLPSYLASSLYMLQELFVYPWNSLYQGRLHHLHPAPQCCAGEACTAAGQQRHAVVTSLRSDRYLPLLQGMQCSLNRSNPGLPLLVLTAPGDLSPGVLQAAHACGQVLQVEDVRVDSSSTYEDGRFDLNWIKLRAWELPGWDALLWLDSDTAVAGNVSPLFNLPTHFAGTLDVARRHRRYTSMGKLQAGVFMLRPCAQTTGHMLQLLAQDSRLRFKHDHAEQDFLDWYFKYSRLALPPEWNFPAHMLRRPGRGNWSTHGGQPVKVVHFTDQKPWQRKAGMPGHDLLC